MDKRLVKKILKTRNNKGYYYIEGIKGVFDSVKAISDNIDLKRIYAIHMVSSNGVDTVIKLEEVL